MAINDKYVNRNSDVGQVLEEENLTLLTKS